jgi:hypothetical protein
MQLCRDFQQSQQAVGAKHAIVIAIEEAGEKRKGGTNAPPRLYLNEDRN